MRSGVRWLGAAACGVAAFSLGVLLLVSVAGAAGPVVTEFSNGITPNSYPEGITAGPDGNVWFVELRGGIGKITPAGAITQYTLPGVYGNGANAIAAGPDGNIWFTSTSGIGKITPSGFYTEYKTGSTDGPGNLVAGSDGRIWFTDSNGFSGSIGAITTSGQVAHFPIDFSVGFPNGIAAGPDGNIWFTSASSSTGIVGKITTGGVVTTYSTGTAGFPTAIADGPDGNLWVAEEGDFIAKVTTNGAVTQYRVGPEDGSSGPFGIAAGPDGNLWFTGGYTADGNVSGDRIGKITTAGVVTDYTYSAGIGVHSGPVGITAGPDGNIWFAEYSGSRIGRLDLHATTPTTPTTSTTPTTPTTTPTPTPKPKPKIPGTLIAAVKGKGTITGGGINCPGKCTSTFSVPTSGPVPLSMTLHAKPAAGYRFAGWFGGVCPLPVFAAGYGWSAKKYSTCKIKISRNYGSYITDSDGGLPASPNAAGAIKVTAKFVRK